MINEMKSVSRKNEVEKIPNEKSISKTQRSAYLT